jgi:hypothetical protein
MMRDFDEETIWTSDMIPLIASYHKGFLFHISLVLCFPFFISLRNLVVACREVSAFCLAN